MAKLIDTVPIPIKESMEEPSAKVLHIHCTCTVVCKKFGRESGSTYTFSGNEALLIYV